MKALSWFLLLAFLTACAHQAKKVDCDRHLVAINPPTPVVKADDSHKPNSP
jgi:hypothetical protein